MTPNTDKDVYTCTVPHKRYHHASFNLESKCMHVCFGNFSHNFDMFLNFKVGF